MQKKKEKEEAEEQALVGEKNKIDKFFKYENSITTKETSAFKPVDKVDKVQKEEPKKSTNADTEALSNMCELSP